MRNGSDEKQAFLMRKKNLIFEGKDTRSVESLFS